MYKWLTPDSELYLKRDYLLEGQTVDQRVDIICNNAEEILKKKDFAKSFKEFFKKGWYSFSSPIWSNSGTKRGLPISCVTGDTWINTKIDGGKQAKDICVGDNVLTHKGRYKKVTNIIVTENKSNIYKLKVCNRMTNLHLTGDHLVLTNLGWIRVDELDTNKHLVAINRELEFSENDYNIFLKDYCDYEYVIKNGRIYKKGCDSVRKDRRVEIVSYYASPFEQVSLDSDLAWALGLWFAEGSVSISSKKEPNGVRVTLDSDEKEIAARWLKIMTSKLGISGSSYESEVVRKDKINSWINVNVNSKIIGNFFASFGDNCKNKTIPQWIIDSPKHVLESFLNGLLSGDGSERENHCKLTLANPRLILQAYQIGLKLGRKMSLQMQEKAGPLSSMSHVYTLIFRDYKVSCSRFSSSSAIDFSDGLSYSPIRSLELTNKTETVYDFTVEEDHSFSAAGVLLHNCFGSYLEDTCESIADTYAEIFMMTKHGGGTSAYFGNIRGRGEPITDNGETAGSVHFMQPFENLIQVVSQGSTRRGNLAVYLPIDHKDIMEFLNLRMDGNKIQDLSFGVCVSNDWMESMIAGDKSKRTVWAKVLERRASSGFPFIFFTDNANNSAADVYQDKGMKIWHTNLCVEIKLPNGPDESFVCDLSSMNILHFDEWKNTNAVELMTYFLDAIMTEFINKAQNIKHLHRAVRFAERHRALGIGWFGWHHYLQSKMIPWETMEAKNANVTVAKHIFNESRKASAKLAQEYGEPELLKGYGRRNTTTCAIAPTKSSAFIIGQASESIEPCSNYEIKDLQKGKYTVKNPVFKEFLKTKGKDEDAVWDSVSKKSGSVQHLSFLSEHEKAVFKTLMEISPKELIIQAAQRQKYIDQGQSLNLFIDPSVSAREVNALMIEGWRLGINSYYYQKSVNAAQQLSQSLLHCVSCE